MSPSPRPADTDAAFLRTFRRLTGTAWKRGWWLEPAMGMRMPLGAWERRLRWQDGLDDAQLERLESSLKARFAPDHRRFLATMHCERHPKSVTPTKYGPMFLDLIEDRRAMRAQTAKLTERVVPLAERVWPPGWGAKPATAAARAARLRELVAAAPRLIAIMGSRKGGCFVLAEPGQMPRAVVFSIVDGHVAAYPSFVCFLWNKYRRLLAVRGAAASERFGQLVDASCPFGVETPIAAIPFWGELALACDRM